MAAAANIRVGSGKLASGTDVSLAGLDPRLATQVVKLDWVDGSDDALRALGPRDAMLEVGFAKERSLRVGSRSCCATPSRSPCA